MKFLNSIVILGMAGSILSCETDLSNQPTSAPGLRSDSVGKFEAKPTNSQVTAYGGVTNSGKLAVTRGGVLSESPDSLTLTLAKKVFKETAGGVGNFGILFSALKPRTTYYYKLYAQNQMGTVYGPEVSFLSPPLSPKLTASPATNIASSSATFNGTLTANGGESVYVKGFVYGFVNTVTLETGTRVDIADTTVAAYSADVTGLQPKTKYFYRAFAINRGGTTYGTGAVPTFTTLP